jgi:polysaccharide deacetylase family protein (PEP-CTERM system associated)
MSNDEEGKPSAMLNALTVDVEDYFMVSAFSGSIPQDQWGAYEPRVEGNTRRLLDIFDRYRVKGTFFVVGWVAEKFPGIVREICRRGHEIGCHSHRHRLVYDLSPEEFRRDTRNAKAILEDILGESVLGYRAPSYSITPRSQWALEILAEEGFRYDSSIFPIHHDRYGFPEHGRFAEVKRHNGAKGILEIPMSTLRILGKNVPIAGGGYFRFYPYRLTAWGIRKLNEKEDQPTVFYIHPWEIDPQQPRMQGSLLSTFRHYVNLGKNEGKLGRLLGAFRFAPVKEVFQASLKEREFAVELPQRLGKL